MMILLGNKQNSLILLGFFSFSRMEIPVYNLGECTPWDLSTIYFALLILVGVELPLCIVVIVVTLS